MFTDKHPRDGYTDLLDEQADPALVHDLDRLHRPPPPHNLRPTIARAIEQRAATHRAQAPVLPWWRPVPTSRRLGVALVALLAFTMLAAAAPLIVAGSPAKWLDRAGYHRIDPDSLDVTMDAGFILDGEVYPGGALTIRQAAPISFVSSARKGAGFIAADSSRPSPIPPRMSRV